MDARKARGLQLAQRGNIIKLKSGWRVPSQSGSGSYFVRLHKTPSCTCPDFERWLMPCKHIYAVEYRIAWETTTEGAQTVTTTTETVKVTYRQNWPAYNAAQTEEKARFIVLLNALCQLVQQPPQANGRPRLPVGDMIFACVYKVYCCFSSRRFMSDLREAQSKERIYNLPHFNSVSNYMVDPALTDTLSQLVTISSLPLKSLENHFAVDSSGFSTCRFVKWCNKKYGREMDNREWVKVH
jgi:hypothetical protein